MDYECWREDIFGRPPDSDPVLVELLRETDSAPEAETLDHVDRALVDAEIHDLFAKDQIGIGLNLIYNNDCSNLPFCYVEGSDDDRKITGIRNLRHLYANFFERYCRAPVKNIGDMTDGRIGYLCEMFWDIFVLYRGNASPGMVTAGLEVMEHALRSENDNCIVSAVHGLGHWALDTPDAVHVLQRWLQHPTTGNEVVLEYANDATTGMIQ